MSIAAQRLAVEAAERQVLALRAEAAQKSVALKVRAQRRWVPAALLGAGGLIGFWLDSRLGQHSNQGTQSTRETSVQRDEASSSAITPALSALASVSMLLKLWRDVAPIAEHFVQRAGKPSQSHPSGNQTQTQTQASTPAGAGRSTASEPSQVTDAPPTQH